MKKYTLKDAVRDYIIEHQLNYSYYNKEIIEDMCLDSEQLEWYEGSGWYDENSRLSVQELSEKYNIAL